MESLLDVKVARLHKLESNSSVKAFVDIAVNDSLLLKGIRVVEGKNGIFVSMPREKGKDNKWYETIIPMNERIRSEISNEILYAYNGK